MRNARANTSQPAQIDALTGIRGVAAFWVMMLHLQFYRPHGALALAGVRELSRDGWLAVDLFFVLSGFIMMHVHGADFARPTRKAAQRFYLLRFIRIYPVHFVVLLAHVALLLLAIRLGVGFSAQAFTPRSFELSLFMLNGWGIPGSEGWNVPSWSVSSEWFAYLLFPLIAAIVLRVRSRRGALVAAFAILFFTWSLGGYVSDWHKYMLPFWGVLIRVTTEFVLGCLAYRFYSRPIPPRIAELSVELALATIIGVSLSSLGAIYDGLFIVAFVPLVVGLSQANGPVGWVMRTRPMVYLGRISYSAYIVHALVLGLYIRAVQAMRLRSDLGVEILIVLGFVVVVTASASILYAVVEEPARHWLRRSWLHQSEAQTVAREPR